MMASERWLSSAFLLRLPLTRWVQRRDDAEVDVHGLEYPYGLIADIQPQSADGRFLREVDGGLPLQGGGAVSTPTRKPLAQDST